MAELAEQHATIDRLNAKYRGKFRLIKGIEANIRADGSVDMTRRRTAAAGNRRRRAALGAALGGRSDRAHAGAVSERPACTSSGIRAGECTVRGRASPRMGRGVRGGGEERVAIEIDGDPARQDIDYELARTRGGRRLPVRARQRRARDRRASHTPRQRSRMRDWPACPRNASSTAGRSTGSSNGHGRGDPVRSAKASRYSRSYSGPSLVPLWSHSDWNRSKGGRVRVRRR